MRRLVVLMILAAAPAAAQAPGLSAPAASSATTTSRFDGSWEVTMTCASSAEVGLGYTMRFQALVRGGQLAAETTGAPDAGRVKMDGPIRSDGTAAFRAESEPPRDARRAGRRSLERWTAEAQFVGGHGTGRRVEQRRCDLLFQRRR